LYVYVCFKIRLGRKRRRWYGNGGDSGRRRRLIYCYMRPKSVLCKIISSPKRVYIIMVCIVNSTQTLVTVCRTRSFVAHPCNRPDSEMYNIIYVYRIFLENRRKLGLPIYTHTECTAKCYNDLTPKYIKSLCSINYSRYRSAALQGVNILSSMMTKQ